MTLTLHWVSLYKLQNVWLAQSTVTVMIDLLYRSKVHTITYMYKHTDWMFELRILYYCQPSRWALKKHSQTHVRSALINTLLCVIYQLHASVSNNRREAARYIPYKSLYSWYCRRQTLPVVQDGRSGEVMETKTVCSFNVRLWLLIKWWSYCGFLHHVVENIPTFRETHCLLTGTQCRNPK
jgi:hypothetical protein